MTRSTPELASLSPNFCYTPLGGPLTLNVIFNVHQAHIHCGSSVVSGFEPRIIRRRSQDLTTRTPRPLLILKPNEISKRTLFFYTSRTVLPSSLSQI
ncbi:hypothetical protein AVEN_35437-1 [Araneus ventricosus]|uniref:Uncharacterized protein n=1 Tax=Araneus ventricosus TaxID=182803 RepID=A0A4Y2WJD0_ARAVE|nr:hypothetical protein AVEN_35437-1 [Araneus ventricosus]